MTEKQAEAICKLPVNEGLNYLENVLGAQADVDGVYDIRDKTTQQIFSFFQPFEDSKHLYFEA